MLLMSAYDSFAVAKVARVTELFEESTVQVLDVSSQARQY